MAVVNEATHGASIVDDWFAGRILVRLFHSLWLSRYCWSGCLFSHLTSLILKITISGEVVEVPALYEITPCPALCALDAKQAIVFVGVHLYIQHVNT